MKVLAPSENVIRRIVQAINELIQGRGNASGEMTLTAGTTTTTVSRDTISGQGQVFLFPKTANAAAAVATTYATIASAGGAFTVTHANAASTDRTFAYVVLGG